MRLLVFGDFPLTGSGYQAIIAGLSEELTARGHEIVIIGERYNGSEHHYRATVVPARHDLVLHQIEATDVLWHPDVLLVFADPAEHEQIVSELRGHHKAPYIGVFPLDGGLPVAPASWTAALKEMRLAYSISDFGARECTRACGVDVRHLPVGIDSHYWRPPNPAERAEARKDMPAGQFNVLTVCANQERKNLPGAVQAMAMMGLSWPQTVWTYVGRRTRSDWTMQMGHDIPALTKLYHLDPSRVNLVETGVSRDELRRHYWAADAFLLTTCGEGYGLPVLEAMACGLAVVVSAVCHFPEMLRARGLTIPVAHSWVDACGNEVRADIDSRAAAVQVGRLVDDPELRVHLAYAGRRYAESLTWAKTADAMEEGLREII